MQVYYVVEKTLKWQYTYKHNAQLYNFTASETNMSCISKVMTRNA